MHSLTGRKCLNFLSLYLRIVIYQFVFALTIFIENYKCKAWFCSENLLTPNLKLCTICIFVWVYYINIRIIVIRCHVISGKITQVSVIISCLSESCLSYYHAMYSRSKPRHCHCYSCIDISGIVIVYSYSFNCNFELYYS